MRLRGINQTQLKIDLNNKPVKRTFIKKTIYYKPNDVSLKKANKLLYTFAYTRHPFRRLVSGYHFIIGRNNQWETVNQFMGIINGIMSKNRKLHPRNGHDIPTPKMFVNYLLDEAKQHGPIFLNSHFRPQYAVCPFCSLNFNYIGDIEDMDTHVKFLAKRFGFPVIHKNTSSLLE